MYKSDLSVTEFFCNFASEIMCGKYTTGIEVRDITSSITETVAV